MECPQCHNAMQKLQRNLLRNPPERTTGHTDCEQQTANKRHKEYERTLYVCDADDIWITVEQPASNQ